MKRNLLSALIISSVFASGNAMAASTNEDLLAYLQPPTHILKPSESQFDCHKTQNRKFTGIPSMAVTKNGRMFAVWYAGIEPKEDHNNYVVVAQSDDGGNSWKETLIIDPDVDGPIRAFDPEIWVDPTGKLWVFWAQVRKFHQGLGTLHTKTGVWALQVENPDAATLEWSEPKRFMDGVIMCKPMTLSTGEWVFPITDWGRAYETEHTCQMYVSSDKGENWELRGAARVPKNTRNFEENMIIEKKDGSLWMLGRLRAPHGIGESFSSDRGKTWSDLLPPTEMKHICARFFVYTLKSGNLLMVKHGEIDEYTKGRKDLKAFISTDDGKTWSKGITLDERLGVSYPDGQEHNGQIYLTWDYNRRADQKILMTHFSEAALLDGTAQKQATENRKTISTGGKNGILVADQK